MKKRLLSLISVIAMGAVMLTAAGCGTSDDNGSSTTNTTDVEPKVTMGEYIGMDVEVEVETVSDEDVDKAIVDALNSNAELVEVTDRAVEDGDTVNIDYVGKIDGVAFDGGTAEGSDLVIGSGSFIDDFEEQLIGANIGDTLEINVTFPDPYNNNPDLAGKEAVFTVVINSIKSSPSIDLTDDAINEYTEGEYTNLDAYREYTRAELEATAESNNLTNKQAAVLEKLMSVCSVENPTASRVQKYVDNYYTMYESYASMYSMEFADFVETYLGTTEEGFETQVRTSSEYYVSYILVMEEIADEQGIKIDEEEYQSMLESEAATNSADTSEYEATYGDFMKDELIYSAVMDYLISVSNITEVPASS